MTETGRVRWGGIMKIWSSGTSVGIDRHLLYTWCWRFNFSSLCIIKQIQTALIYTKTDSIIKGNMINLHTDAQVIFGFECCWSSSVSFQNKSIQTLQYNNKRRGSWWSKKTTTKDVDLPTLWIALVVSHLYLNTIRRWSVHTEVQKTRKSCPTASSYRSPPPRVGN